MSNTGRWLTSRPTEAHAVLQLHRINVTPPTSTRCCQLAATGSTAHAQIACKRDDASQPSTEDAMLDTEARSQAKVRQSWAKVDHAGCAHLELGLLVERDVGHLLAGVKQRVLGGLGEHVLRRAHQHRRKQRRQPNRRQPRRQRHCSRHTMEITECETSSHNLTQAALPHV